MSVCVAYKGTALLRRLEILVEEREGGLAGLAHRWAHEAVPLTLKDHQLARRAGLFHRGIEFDGLVHRDEFIRGAVD